MLVDGHKSNTELDRFSTEEIEQEIVPEGAAVKKGAVLQEIKTKSGELSGRKEDIKLLRNARFDVDNNDEPAPKNLPIPEEPKCSLQMGWKGIDQRQLVGGTESSPLLRYFTEVNSLQEQSLMDMFLSFFFPK